ncbi:zinc finger CCCH domain-containing protein 44-like isoform X1 [Oryza glaberrima]|uniref:zinc finger CCCH domain-containing protein 44-like isoform X1 n=1 Tax=Oryza glaberrima TaxID=4538 RepID=UPI00224C44CF|nr:zinc finger CCCH domain-containing protein 44-like isoform X1 [Oryza glaberrima]
MGRRSKQKVEDMAEELCFVCKDGGDIRVCDFKNCLKGYHPHCVGKEESFLDSAEQFICELHKCVSCKRNSEYHCLCCPSSSVCGECLGKVEFAQFRKQSQTKGLCNNCLKLALFVEKNSEANSDGETVEFRYTENYLVLFKDYWETIKDNEGLALIDLQQANICLRTSLSCKQGRDSEKPPDEDYRADKNSLSVNDGAEQPFPVDVKVQPSEAKMSLKRKKSNKKTYVGWGSKELIEFLSCIGKDTTKPLDEFILTGVVKEYIQQKNLFKDRKRKSVICDDKLHSLFRKRKVKSNMILNLLEIHLAANAASEDDFLDDSEDDEGRIMRKRPCNTLKAAETSERDPKRNKKCFAALNHNNLKLIYLRRTLIMNLMGQDTFEQKVVGSLVRVKNDDNHYSYQMPKKHYQLGLVTGIRKSPQEYKIKDKRTDILLCVSNLWDDIKISMLSEEDIEEDECNDLLLLAKKGLFKRPTVADLEEKAASIHVDIVNHWIDRELMRLEKEIERAHEKGWRQELHELFNKKRLLSTQDERQRRLAEVPEAIPDTGESKRDEFGVAASNHLEENKGATGHVPNSVKVLMEDSRGATGHIADSVKVLMEGLPGGATARVADVFNVDMAKSQDASGQVTDYLEVVEEETPEDASGQVADILELVEEETSEDASGQVASILEVVEEETPEAPGKNLCNGGIPGSGLQNKMHNAQDGGTAQGSDMCNGGNTSRRLNDRKSVIVIDSDSDEDEDPHPEQHEPERAAPRAAMDVVMAPTHGAPVAMNGTSAPTLPCAKRGKNGTTAPKGRVPAIAALHALQSMNAPGEHEYIWNYADPQGKVQGPFTMEHMRNWHRNRFFPPDFRVWRLGQTQNDSVLLTEAMGLKFSS